MSKRNNKSKIAGVEDASSSFSYDVMEAFEKNANQETRRENISDQLDKIYQTIVDNMKNRSQMTKSELYEADYGAYAEGNASGDVTGLGSWWNKQTGKGLTSAEMAQNAFNAWQAQESRDFDERMANTQYQRGVADMQAAGLNPALAYSQGGAAAPQSPTASAGSSSSGSMNLFQDLVAMMKLPAEIKLAEAEVTKTDAETRKIESETTGKDIENEIAGDTKEDRKEIIRNQVSLGYAEKASIYKNIEKVDVEIGKIIEETHNERYRGMLMDAQTMLATAEAEQIEYMKEANRNLIYAQTDAQEADAAYKWYLAAYQAGLIDAGWIEKQIEIAERNSIAAVIDAAANKQNANTREKEAEIHDECTKLRRSVENGTFFDPSQARTGFGRFVRVTGNHMIQAASLSGQLFESSLTGKAMGSVQSLAGSLTGEGK